jgi:(1->4)-alpha-D-glucan 1-alpha-D-glucosylmutase
VTWRTLQLRAKYPGLFSAGQYIPLSANGRGENHVFAFARSRGSELAAIAVPRFFTQLTPDLAQLPLGEKVWQDTAISLATDRQLDWVNQFTGQSIAPSKGRLLAADLFSHFPVALLMAKR